MVEGIISIGILALYVLISLKLNDRIIKIRSNWIFVLSVFAYLVGTYFYFEIINRIDNVLSDKGIYIEFGHGKILLVLIMDVAFIFGIINIILLSIKRAKNRKISKHD